MIKDSVYIQSLIDYINDVKPYSSKLVDVVVEYQFTDTVNAKISDDHFININIAMSDTITSTMADHWDETVGERLSDTVKYKNTNANYPTGYDSGMYDSAPYENPDLQPEAVRSMIFDQVSMVSTPIRGGLITQNISINLPNAQLGDTAVFNVSNVHQVTINHFFGDTNPSGVNASKGGVQVDIVGATATSIVNPYASNSPVLYTTTRISFATPSTCSITLTVTRP